MKKVLVAGNINLDITPVFKSNKLAKLSDTLTPGKLVEVDNAEISLGGCVSNTGLALRVLGADVILSGKIGNDSFGNIASQIFKKFQCHESILVSETDRTSYSVVLAMPGIDRIFLHYPGASSTYSYDDLDLHAVSEASLFHFGYPPVMQRMYEDNGTELLRIFKAVKSMGVLTSLDMAAIDPASDCAKVDWERLLQKVLPYVDFFVPSIEELCFMLDRDRHHDWTCQAKGKDIVSVLSVEKDIAPLADQVLALGAKTVLIKCGFPGMYLRTAGEKDLKALGESFKTWADLSLFEKSYQEDRFLSATGAGDASIAAFLKAMLDGYSPNICLQLAAATGACCVTAYDALSGLKPFPELLRRIDAGWDKLKR